MEVDDGTIDGDSDALLDDLLKFLDASSDESSQSVPWGAANCAPTLSAVTIDGATTGTSGICCSTPSAVVSASGRAVERQPARHIKKLKRTLDTLRSEAHQLTEELIRMREATARHRTVAMDVALAERFKRRRAEHECEQLREAVYNHARFLRGLRSMFFFVPSVVSDVDLYKQLHNYTRLPADRSTRWNEYAALAQDKRLNAAAVILQHETVSMVCADGGDGAVASVTNPKIQVQVLPMQDGFGALSTCVFAMDTTDIGSVLRSAHVAVHEIVTNCVWYSWTDTKREIVDPDVAASSITPNPSILYRIVGLAKNRLDEHEVSMESRTVTVYKQTDDLAVLLWDFIDDDVLHPHDESTDITREAVGACLIRREVCDDGIERAVFRSLFRRRFRSHDHTPAGVMERFRDALGSEEALRQNELLFRRIMADQITQEQVAYQAALARLGMPTNL